MVKSTQKRNKSQKLIDRVTNRFLLTLTSVILIAFLSAFLRYFSMDPKGGLSSIETIFFATLDTVLIAISVSIFISWMRNRTRGDELDERFEKYEDVMVAAELLHNSKKNHGLSGIVNSPEEENIFEELSKNDYSEEDKPTIWWMNFRIEKYDTFAKSIEDFVMKGGNAHIIITHPENPNIPFRLKEAYPDKRIEDYLDHFKIQARTFISLEKKIENSSQANKGSFKIMFNKESSSYPIFIVNQGLDYKAYSGFYLNDISGVLPYIVWETSKGGMVQKLREYFEYKMKISVTSQEMEEELDRGTSQSS